MAPLFRWLALVFVVSCREPSSPPAAIAIQTVAPVASMRPLPNDSKALRVLIVSDGNAFLRAALLDGPFHVDVVSPAAYPVAGPFDATIFDRVAPPVARDAGVVLSLGAMGGSAPLLTNGVEHDAREGAFERIATDAPMLKFTQLGEVNIESVIRSTAGPRDEVLGSSETLPLLVTGARDGHAFVSLEFDIRRSDLPMRVDWPILLVQAMGTPLGRDLFAVPLAASQWRAPIDRTERSPDTRSGTIFEAASHGFGGRAYRRVYTEYHEVAHQRLAQRELPATVRTYVEHYFDAIAPTTD